jgi:uncharacterized protein YecT (DUF1311 family)
MEAHRRARRYAHRDAHRDGHGNVHKNGRMAGATFLGLLAPFTWTAVQAQVSCNEAGTQQELTACAVEDFKQADRELNEVYSALIKESNHPAIVKKLRAAQRAWIAFRDAEMEATFACDPAEAPCWGSMLPMSMAAYKAKLTRERTARLRQLLEQGRPADGSHPGPG